MIDDREDCYEDMLYDNALDDGPTFLENPPCATIVLHFLKILHVLQLLLTHETIKMIIFCV
jgi:hypothetical protein